MSPCASYTVPPLGGSVFVLSEKLRSSRPPQMFLHHG